MWNYLIYCDVACAKGKMWLEPKKFLVDKDCTERRSIERKGDEMEVKSTTKTTHYKNSLIEQKGEGLKHPC